MKDFPMEVESPLFGGDFKVGFNQRESGKDGHDK